VIHLTLFKPSSFSHLSGSGMPWIMLTGVPFIIRKQTQVGKALIIRASPLTAVYPNNLQLIVATCKLTVILQSASCRRWCWRIRA